MKCVIFYFSGTGNTWWCAKSLESHLLKAGIESKVASIEQVEIKDTEELVRNTNIIGIGYPIYGSDLPLPMKEFIDRSFPARSGRDKKLFTFCTELLFSGDGPWVCRHELRAKGWDISWSLILRMPNNICVSALPIPYTTNQRKIDKRLRYSERKIKRFVSAVAGQRRFTTGKAALSRWLGLMQRNPYRKWFSRLRDDVSIDHDACTRCGICVRNCPSGNLYLDDNNSIQTLGTCILCVRCYNFCPVQAVLYMGKRHKVRRGVPYRGPVPEFNPEIVIRDASILPNE